MNVLYCLLMELVAAVMHRRVESVSVVTQEVGLGCLAALCPSLFVILKNKK